MSTSLAITGEPYPLASNVDTAGYRIVREALTNVVRHANARQHVSRALIKLGARDRAQLVVFACQSGIPVPTL